MYLYPTGIHDDLLESIAQSEKIVHYLDIPIQPSMTASSRPCGDPIPLWPGAFDKTDSKVHPDVVLRTTVIVGFPGETEKEFNQLLRFIQSSDSTHLGASHSIQSLEHRQPCFPIRSLIRSKNRG